MAWHALPTAVHQLLLLGCLLQKDGSHQKQKAWPHTLTLGLQGTHSSQVECGLGSWVSCLLCPYLHSSSKQMAHCHSSMSSSSMATVLRHSSALSPPRNASKGSCAGLRIVLRNGIRCVQNWQGP
jgi:hypothetical protein